MKTDSGVQTLKEGLDTQQDDRISRLKSTVLLFVGCFSHCVFDPSAGSSTKNCEFVVTVDSAK
jgi:hypothetical protein